jgi:hypothetical protein
MAHTTCDSPQIWHARRLPEAYRTAGSLSGVSLMCGFLAGLCLELADNW